MLSQDRTSYNFDELLEITYATEFHSKIIHQMLEAALPALPNQWYDNAQFAGDAISKPFAEALDAAPPATPSRRTIESKRNQMNKINRLQEESRVFPPQRGKGNRLSPLRLRLKVKPG